MLVLGASFSLGLQLVCAVSQAAASGHGMGWDVSAIPDAQHSAFEPWFPCWILLNVRALCCVASCSNCARTYRNPPFYNGNVVFKAKLSVVSL